MDAAAGMAGALPAPAMTDHLVRLILARLHDLQARVDAGDVAAHLLRERMDELRQVLGRFSSLVD
jgi:hypothetical protein